MGGEALGEHMLCLRPVCVVMAMLSAMCIEAPVSAQNSSVLDELNVKITGTAGYTSETLGSLNGSTPRELVTPFANVGAEFAHGNWFFGLEAGARSMSGTIGSGPTALSVNSRGLRTTGYVAHQLVPGLIAGLGGVYQLDTGSLSNDFVDVDAMLEGGELLPFLLAFVPVADGKFEIGANGNLVRARLRIQGQPTDFFNTYDAEFGVKWAGPVHQLIMLELGGTGRYTFREDVVLGGASRAKLSARFEAALSFAIDTNTEVMLSGYYRAFDELLSEDGVNLQIKRSF